MASFEEAVEIDYNRVQGKSNETRLEEKDNSMFGQEILRELGINKNESNEHENEEIDLLK